MAESGNPGPARPSALPMAPSRPSALPMERPKPRRSWATFRTVSALMLREMSTRYGRSPGGYAWALLEPVGAIIVMAIGFGLMLDRKSVV